MEEEVGRITFTKTDDGFRVEAKGKHFRDMIPCCSQPIFASGGVSVANCCCPPEEGKVEKK